MISFSDIMQKIINNVRDSSRMVVTAGAPSPESTAPGVFINWGEVRLEWSLQSVERMFFSVIIGIFTNSKKELDNKVRDVLSGLISLSRSEGWAALRASIRQPPLGQAYYAEINITFEVIG